MFDPVHVGVDEYGEQVHVNLAERTCWSAASQAAASRPG